MMHIAPEPYYRLNGSTLYQGHVLDVLPQMAAESVQCIVTSPPYWGLRDYGLPPLEWPTVRYAPMSGLAEIEVPGCAPGCEHVWGDGPTMTSSAQSNKPSESFHVQKDERAQGKAFSVTQGQYCQRCGGWRGSYGLEPTVEMYVAHTVAICRELKRVLRDDGCMFWNLGDSYASSGQGHYGQSAGLSKDSWSPEGTQARVDATFYGRAATPTGLKPKDLIGIPWRVALALQADGWFLRSAIIWAKSVSFCPTYSGSCMPESVRDRPTQSYEHVLLLAKSARYYYDGDAVREAYTIGNGGRQRAALQGETAPRIKSEPEYSNGGTGLDHTSYEHGGRNLRSVWTINSGSYSGAHFATFPPALVEPMIKAGTSAKGCCPECGSPWERVTERERVYAAWWADSVAESPSGKHGEHAQGSGVTQDIRMGPKVSVTTTGWTPTCTCCEPLPNGIDTIPYQPQPCTVLDPFAGTFTTGEVAIRLRRRAIGIELSKEYCDEHIIPRLEQPLQMELAL